MAAATWVIIYDLDRAHADRYLRWFDEVHIPEKLARPGYTWAAHYRVIADAKQGDSCYIALFGGTDSRVFLDPSPAQIKPKQPPETRAMMAHRSNSKMLILSEEWTFDSDNTAADSSPRIDAESIGVALLDAGTNDENLGAWLLQDYLADAGITGVARKFLASAGDPRHVLVHEFGKHETAQGSTQDASPNAWSERVSSVPSCASVSALVARRVWPPVA